MTTEKINVVDTFTIIGGSDSPPKKKDLEDLEKSKIPYSENDIDVEGMILIQED